MVKTEIQIRFSDCDMMQHVNNAKYLEYFELSRINFFTQQLPNWNWTEKGIILAKNTIEYKQPVFLTDRCEIEVNCIKIGKSSFTLSYHLYAIQNSDKILKSFGESVLVCYDFITNKSTDIYKELKDVLQKNLI